MKLKNLSADAVLNVMIGTFVGVIALASAIGWFTNQQLARAAADAMAEVREQGMSAGRLFGQEAQLRKEVSEAEAAPNPADAPGLDAGTSAALRAQFDALDASARHGWRLGPSLGLDYPRLQPLLAQVPADEHEALLRTLRAMDPAQRDKLAVLVQRTPPQARAALRRELVSTSDANRAAWLLLRLER